MKRVAIVGGGLAGVASAYFQRKRWGKETQIFLIEKTTQCGGWIQSILHEGFFFEQGPRSFRGGPDNRHVLALIEEIGLQQDWVGSHPSCHTRYLYLEGRLQPLPKNIFSFLLSPLSQGMWKALFQACQKRTLPLDESITDFFTRYLPPSWVKRWIDPLVSGIYAGDPDQLSIQSCFPRLHRAVRETGSLLLGGMAIRKTPSLSPANSPASSWVAHAEKFPSFSFQKGLHQLIDRLLERACPTLLCNTTTETPIWKDHTILLPLSSGNTLEVDTLIFALPFSSLSGLLPPLRPLVEAIPLASVALVHCGYSQKVLRTPGFGYLLPFTQGNPLLGATFDSCFFPQHNQEPQERITLMMGGMRHPHTLDLSDAELFALAARALRQQMGVFSPPAIQEIRRLRHAIPQYHLGHQARCRALHAMIKSLYPRLSITGSCIAGISMPEVLLHAQQQALNDGMNF